MSKVSLHLVSMPWANPMITPMQLGAIKAYVQPKIPDLKIHVHNGFFMIPRLAIGDNFVRPYDEMSEFNEHAYQYLALRRFAGPHQAQLQDIIPGVKPKTLSKIEKATRKFCDAYLIPKLDASALNLVGFTLNYDQVYSSLYCALYLKEKCKDTRILFVLGGMSACTPSANRIFNEFGLEAVAVVGEGEQKLYDIIQTANQHASDPIPQIIGHLSSVI